MLSGRGLKDNIWPSTVGIWSVLGTSVSLPCEVSLSDTGRITVLNTTMLSIIENLQINKNKYLLIKNRPQIELFHCRSPKHHGADN